MKFSFSEIIEGQKKPLDWKVAQAIEAMHKALSLCSTPAIAFSGGKDSTVLLHLAKTFFPDQKFYVLFSNTTVEFPESLAFVRKLAKEWGNGNLEFIEVLPEKLEKDELKYEAQKEVLTWLEHEGRLGEVLKDDGKLKSTGILGKKATPEMWEDFRKRGLVWTAGTRKNYNYCCDQYGYPILSKAACKLTARRINIDCFLKYSKTETENADTLEFYDLLRNVKTSNHCCSVLKKEPAEKKQAELGVDCIFKGLMAAESHARMLNFATRGYIFESHRKHAEKFYHCSPLGFWTDDDIWEYIHTYEVPYSSLYDMTYTDSKGQVKHVKRNGCVGCATDIAYRDNHLSALKQTHPKLYAMYMGGGLGQEIAKWKEYENAPEE